MVGQTQGTKRLTVFTTKKVGKMGVTVWTRAGIAFVNKDGSLSIWLDALPLDGKLHVRETPAEKYEGTPVGSEAMAVDGNTDLASVPVEGHS